MKFIILVFTLCVLLNANPVDCVDIVQSSPQSEDLVPSDFVKVFSSLQKSSNETSKLFQDRYSQKLYISRAYLDTIKASGDNFPGVGLLVPVIDEWFLKEWSKLSPNFTSSYDLRSKYITEKYIHPDFLKAISGYVAFRFKKGSTDKPTEDSVNFWSMSTTLSPITCNRKYNMSASPFEPVTTDTQHDSQQSQLPTYFWIFVAGFFCELIYACCLMCKDNDTQKPESATKPKIDAQNPESVLKPTLDTHEV